MEFINLSNYIELAGGKGCLTISEMKWSGTFLQNASEYLHMLNHDQNTLNLKRNWLHSNMHNTHTLVCTHWYYQSYYKFNVKTLAKLWDLSSEFLVAQNSPGLPSGCELWIRVVANWSASMSSSRALDCRCRNSATPYIWYLKYLRYFRAS